MESYSLPIHFEILDNKHQVSSVTLNTFIESYKEIFEELFEQKIEIKIGLAKEGGWLADLILMVGIEFVIPLSTGHSIEEIGKKFHQRSVKLVNEFITSKAENTTLEKYSRKCIEQKNKIYQQFQDDKCIISFDLDKLPPIPRDNFSFYIKDLPEENSLYCGEAKISVSSPNWKINNKRAWQGEIDILDNKKVAFDFDKELTGKFWEKIKLNAINTTSGFDVMIVQLIRRLNSKPQYRVIRVLNFNKQTIDSPLSDHDISGITTGIITKNIDSKEEDKRQMELFNQLEK